MVGLGCPRCQGRLNKQADGRLSCGDCKINFPMLATEHTSVPFAWPEPGAALLDWRNRYNLALAEIESQITLTAAPQETLLRSSIDRITALHDAYIRYQTELTQLCEPLQVGEALAKETLLALKTKLPSHHGVLSYAQNMHRDWCWGEDENQRVKALLLQCLAQAPAPQSILVLGSGAGRLAYDLHQHFKPTATWALDSNPLLCLLGARMAAGEHIEFTEFPLAPISSAHSAIERTLSAPEPTQGLFFVCADALNPPFQAQQFDLVVTPWLLDVVDASLADCLNSIAGLVKPSGFWLNHGSVAFQGTRPENCMTAEELAECSLKHGFEVLKYEDVWLPYLQSPASRQQRQELTYTQLARYTDSAAPKRSKHQHLPDWIVTGKTPIPLSSSFQAQITTVRVHAFIMSLIDGKRSLQDMASVMEQQRLMPAKEAAQAIRGFLTTMYEEAVHKDGRAQS